ncbi:unnamed protein product [Brugia pahangi]|uniref:Ion_trans_2 domain-containing protein n=1 Tax=Brugia pahangi TaxID=6280 RepID=A0A0N4TIB7_BRUPA|nr:unnamed protein product [Brugia pahangi]
MIMNLYNNYNINDGVTGSNIDNNNSNDKDSIEFTTVAAVTSSPRPSCSSISVMVEGGLKWKTSVVPVGAISTLPRRDFHFKVAFFYWAISFMGMGDIPHKN